MAGRQEAIHAKKLEQALRSQEKFPINLEWMVDVFKYKHISSLTTHLKRHFKMNVHYKRFSQEQNKRVWTYFISVECFIGICEYVRHAARKKIANVWLRKVGVKGSARRAPRDLEDYAEISEDNEEFDFEDDEEQMPQEGGLEEDYEEDNDYDYYDNVRASKKRRIIDDDDEEYQCEEEDEDEEEREYFQEMVEEEEEESVEYDSEDSIQEYDSSSPYSLSHKRRATSLTVIPFHNVQDNQTQSSLHLSDGVSSSTSSPPCSPPSSPVCISSSASSSFSSTSSSSCSSPIISNPRYQLTASTGAPPPSPSPLSLSSSGGIPPPAPLTQPCVNYSQVPLKPQVVPQADQPVPTEMWKDQDWSYLHLRPNNPAPLSMSEVTNKYVTSLMLSPQFFYYPQIVPYNYLFTPGNYYTNCQSLYFSHMDPASFGMRPTDSFHSDHSNVNLIGEVQSQFDTNMFLSLPEDNPFNFQQY